MDEETKEYVQEKGFIFIRPSIFITEATKKVALRVSSTILYNL
jgi:hypothetical protein